MTLTSYDWYPQRSGRRDRPSNMSMRRFAAEVVNVGYNWNEIKTLVMNSSYNNEFVEPLSPSWKQ